MLGQLEIVGQSLLNKAQDITANDIAYCSSGRLNWLASAKCWQYPLDTWRQFQGQIDTGTSLLAAPGVPGSLTTPPESGVAAQQEVDAIIKQQMINQQGLNANAVQPTSDFWSQLNNLFSNNNPTNELSWYQILLIGGLVGVSVAIVRG